MTQQKISDKKEVRQEKAAYKEHLTNWYMLNLTYGILGIVILLILGSCYKNIATVAYMQTVTWSLTAGFAAAAIAVFALGKAGVIKNVKRADRYSVLLLVCSAFGLWLSLFNKIRVIAESVCRSVTGNPNFIVTSYWNIRIPIILIAAYLIVSFIVYAIKVTRK